MMKIMVTFDLDNRHLLTLGEVFPGVNVVKALDTETQQRELPDTEVVLTTSMSFDTGLLAEARQLKWIQSWAAGVDNYTTPEVIKELVDGNVKLTTMSGIHGNIIAEHTMGLVISFSRRLYRFHEQQKKNIWRHLEIDQLEGRKMTIVGLGSIGREIACRARAFKMQTIGVKRTVNEKIDCVDHLYSNDELHEALARADYVVSIVPLTDETTRMFGKDEFLAMKDSAYFLNLARGEVVYEEELILALKKGWIAGAGLDVFEEEPLPVDSPLYQMDNVLITPHVAGIHPDYHQNALELFMENLERYRQGMELANLVDYNRGY